MYGTYYAVIALWVLDLYITPTDQSIDFSSLYLWLLAVAQQMEFQAFHNLHSVYHDYSHCQPTFFKFSNFLTETNNRRSLFTNFTTTRKNVNT